MRRAITVFALSALITSAGMMYAPVASASEVPAGPGCAELLAYPYNQLCDAPQDVIDVVFELVGETWIIVNGVLVVVDNTADAVYQIVSCTVFPNDPDCP